MTSIHKRAVFIAAWHFTLCGILAGLVLLTSVGYGMSDAYNSPAWSFVAMDRLLLFFEAPVFLVFWLIYHPAARFEPPGYYAVDFPIGAHFFLALGLCVVWSILFGYTASWLVRLFTSRRRRVRRH